MMPLPEASPTGHLPFEPPASSPPDFAEFWQLWRQERFWACHEALEDVWRTETDSKRRLFLQGLIHCAVAVFQHRRSNAIGAARQWVRANVRLEPFLPQREGIDLKEMLWGIQQEIGDSLAKPHQGLSELEVRLREQTRLKM